jgi:hypothetical protein
MQHTRYHALFVILLLAIFSQPVIGQNTRPERALTIEGKLGQADVIQKDGRAYVDLQALVEITSGSLTSKDGRIVLRLPATAPTSSAPQADEPSTQTTDLQNGLSKDFMRAGIEEIATMREWASTLAYAIQNNYQVTEEWAAKYREQAAHNLQQASAVASTDADRKALALLTNEFESVRTWSDELVAAKRSMDTAKYALSPGALRNEPLSQKIVTCGRFLASMLGSSSFQDDPSCH